MEFPSSVWTLPKLRNHIDTGLQGGAPDTSLSPHVLLSLDSENVMSFMGMLHITQEENLETRSLTNAYKLKFSMYIYQYRGF